MLTRRAVLGSAAGLSLAVLGHGGTSAMADIDRAVTLPNRIRQRLLPGINGLTVNILETGYETPNRPAVLLLHGFPDLAYSWRKTMLPLAAAGFHVIAPDQRGYGLTTGWENRYDGDVASFRTHNYARDALGIVRALGYRSVEAIIGHDFGSMIAAYCALARPDVFRSLVMMSFPFDGPPPLPFGTADEAPMPPKLTLAAELAALPHLRQDSMAWFGTRSASDDMLHAPQGLRAFLRAYFHVKSADYPGNHPHLLSIDSAAELATLPTYYVMDKDVGVAATVGSGMPSPSAVAGMLGCRKPNWTLTWSPSREPAFKAG